MSSSQTKAADGPWWETGVVDRDIHGSLIADRVAVARRAGLGERNMDAIWTRMPDAVKADLRRWAGGICDNRNVPNVVLTGDPAWAREVMVALTGALVRSLRDCRLLSIDDICDIQYEVGFVPATVLIVPDFHIEGETMQVPEARRQVVRGVLRKRLMENRPMLLYSDGNREKPWGTAFHREMEAFATMVA